MVILAENNVFSDKEGLAKINEKKKLGTSRERLSTR